MAKLFEDIVTIQNKNSFLHRYEAIYLKLVLLITTICSRFINIYSIILMLFINTLLLIYINAKRIVLSMFSIWVVLSFIIMTVDFFTSTLTLDVFINLVYGFTTFTSLTLFYLSTSPRYLRMFIGFNVISLTYHFLGYSIKLILDLIDVLKARGWELSPRISSQKYLLRAFAVLLTTRLLEVEEALKARGLEE